MRINYKGKDNHYNRMAEIWFDDESKKEQYIADWLQKTLKIRGWSIVSDWGCIFCTVADFQDYRDFVEDYKELKKSAELYWKFFASKEN